MKVNISNPFKLEILPSECLLMIENSVYNNQWYLYFGDIQKKLFKFCPNKKLIIDFTKCEYICPNFFISLFLTIEKIKENTELIYDIRYKPTDFFKYCVQESLINNNSCNEEVYVETKNYKTIFPFNIIYIEDEKDIDILVDRIIKNFKNIDNIFNNEDEKNIFVIKIKNILYELIDNTYKYAYPDSDRKIAGIYIRYRNATNKTEKLWNEENEINGKTLDTYISATSKIEMFYQDIGIGLLPSFSKKYNIKLDSKRPLRETFKKIFFYNEKNQFNRNTNTDIRGLQYIGKILENGNNYLVVYNEKECVGAYVSNIEQNVHTAFNIKDYEKECSINGLCYMFDLQLEIKNQFVRNDFSKAIDSLSKNENIKINVIDQRNILSIADHSGVLQEKNINDNIIIDNSLETLFLFPGKITSKHTLIWKLKKALENCKCIKNLIICDVLNYEIDLIKFSLNNTNISMLKNGILNIYVVSESLLFEKFSINNNKILITKDPDFLYFNKMFNYVYNVKFYETYVLLMFQKKSEFGKFMITKGKIKWDDDIILDGYINFDILITSPKIFQFLKSNLKRIMPLIGYNKLIALDNMVSRLADEVNSELLLENSDNEIYLGSVLVSGITYNNHRNENNNTIHFFNRNKDEKIPSLFFNPTKLLTSDCKDKYVRIGKSYKIINENDLNQHINNNCFLTEKETFEMLNKSFYQPIICNHMNFYGKHYILDFNYINIFDDKKSLLSEFMTNLINSSLNHYFDQNKCNEFFKECENACGIVYLSHYYTDKIIEKTLDLLPQYQQYIVGLNHINLFRYEQSLEFSNIYRDYIRSLISNYKEKKGKFSSEIKFIIFDTLINSGITRKEIKRYLRSLGVEKVIFVSIIDAQDQRYNKSKNHYSYMALNLPRLGINSSCTICDTKSLFEIFSNEIIDPDLLVRIREISQKWTYKNVSLNHSLISDRIINSISSEEISLCDSQYETTENIKFTKVFPLYLYISGKIRQINDFLLFEKFIKECIEKIDDDSIVLLLTLFLLEFYEECHIKLREKIISIIISKMGNLVCKDISSLSLIVLAKHKNSISPIIEKIDLKKIKLSNDLQILLLYILDFNKLKSKGIEFPKFLENKVKNGDIKKDTYKQFHCQLVNINGDSHDSPLRRLNSNKDKNSYNIAISSITLLKKSIESQIIQFDATYNNDFIDFSDLNNRLDLLLSSLKSNDRISDENIKQINCIFNISMKVHSHLLLPLGISSKYANENIIQRIRSIVSEYNSQHQNARIKFDNNYKLPVPKSGSKELYYIYNGMLTKEIEYALNNVQNHCYNEKNECLVEKVVINERQSNEYYSGILFLNITEEMIQIDIVNNVPKIHKDNIHFKVRYEKEELKNLGVKFEKINNSNTKIHPEFKENCFIQRITIPNINEM